MSFVFCFCQMKAVQIRSTCNHQVSSDPCAAFTMTGAIPKTASAVATCVLRHHPQNRQSSFNMRAPAPSPKSPAQLMHASCPYDSTATRRIFLEVPVSSLTCIILIKSTVHVASSCSRISGGLSCVYLYTLSMFAFSDSL